MEWTGPIQRIAEGKAREAQIAKEIALREQEANRPWYQRTGTGTWEFMKEFIQGAGSTAFESVFGIESPDNDELESKLSYQAGRFAGNVVAGAASIIEILEGLTIIGGSNFLTLVAEVGTGGLASPIVIPLDVAATAAGVGIASHGVFVGRNAIQNGKDTLQKIQSSSSSDGRVGEIKIADKSVKPNDVVPYRPSNSPLENHHGVMDVWAKHNVPNYVSRGANTPTLALNKEQHDATKAVYRQWLYEKTGKKVGGKVDWKSVSPKEIQELTEKMFDAADVPRSARQEYYRAFNQYNFRK